MWPDVIISVRPPGIPDGDNNDKMPIIMLSDKVMGCMQVAGSIKLKQVHPSQKAPLASIHNRLTDKTAINI